MESSGAPRGPLARFRVPLVVLGLGLLAAIHFRMHRIASRALPEAAVLDARGFLRGRLQLDAGARGFQSLLVLDWDARANDRQTLDFGASPRMLEGPFVIDATGRAVPTDVKRDAFGTRLSFSLPAPDAAGAREVAIGFLSPAPEPTFGWGHRALALPWATRIVPPRAPYRVEVTVSAATSAPDWRCTQIEAERVCTTEPRHRRVLAVPIGPYDDAPLRITFAIALFVAVPGVMWAIWRRWSRLAEDMGFRDEVMQRDAHGLDEAPGLTDFLDEARRAHATERVTRGSVLDRNEGDPLEAVALIARGITAVLGVVGSIFLVSWFEGGLLPIPEPLALAIWTVIGGVIVVVAVGIDRPRPWAALACVFALGLVAFVPRLSWILPGIAPIAAAVLMQLTARTPASTSRA